MVDFIGEIAVFGTQKLAGIWRIPPQPLDVAIKGFLRNGIRWIIVKTSLLQLHGKVIQRVIQINRYGFHLC